ncbi:MAG: hypothetical protein LBR45_00010 [Bacteroidales bacterium]|jgi:hypothetical protein|nr:hypothetical protein [Bacteroidales bacterium]
MELELLKDINARFNKELEQQINGTLPKGHIYKLGVPEDILGNYVYSSEIELSATRLNEKSQYKRHVFELKEVLNLPQALSIPIAIFKYGDKNKALNIIIELQKNDKNFLVGLSLNPTVKGRKLEIHSIRNVFPKDNAEWLNWIAQDKSIYLNKEKIQVQISQQRMTSADVSYLNLELVAKLVKDFDNTKYMLDKMTI